MSKKLIFVIPKIGLKVINPTTRKPIKEGGEHVEKSTYWSRRILCGDVIVGVPEMEKPVENKKEEVEEYEYQQFEKEDGGN